MVNRTVKGDKGEGVRITVQMEFAPKVAEIYLRRFRDSKIHNIQIWVGSFTYPMVGGAARIIGVLNETALEPKDNLDRSKKVCRVCGNVHTKRDFEKGSVDMLCVECPGKCCPDDEGCCQNAIRK